ncbi:MAG: hypothetical protein IJX81_05655 [Clostridia bacterium]|nr:hypothetical protein [Clostridia bacterium]
MKKIFTAVLPLFYFIIAVFAYAPPPERAVAETVGSEYACILGEETYFYSEENERSGLFILPSTYYVHVLVASYPYSRVEYLSDGVSTRKLVGYCLTSELTFVEYIPKSPYLFKTFEVTYTAENGDLSDPFLNKLTVTCAYYGDYTVGSKTYAYVLQGDEFGYVPKPSTLTYAKNTEYEEYSKSLSPTPSEKEEGEGVGTVQIAILIVLCLLVPILAAAVFRSTKKQPYDFEED